MLDVQRKQTGVVFFLNIGGGFIRKAVEQARWSEERATSSSGFQDQAPVEDDGRCDDRDSS